MIPKQNRLGRKLFADVYKKGKRSPLALFLTVHSEAPTPARFAVVVPKKIAGTAVLRNKIRRRVYSAIRSSPLYQEQGTFIFICRKGIEEKKLPEIKALLTEFVKKS